MAKKEVTADRRPAVVTIAGWVAAITFPMSLLAFLLGPTRALEERLARFLIEQSGLEGGWEPTVLIFLLAVIIGFVVLTLIGVIGFLRMKRWAWVFLVLLMAVGLLVNLLRVWIGAPQYLFMLVFAINALLLNQPEVRRAFRIGERVDEAAV